MGGGRFSDFDPRSQTVPRAIRWTVLATVGVLAVSRAPYILLRGRFWAEEATLHFRYMVSHGFPEDLVYFQARTGYFNVFANVATWLASLVPLRYAPLVTAWCCLALVLFVTWIALAWPSDLLPNAGAKVAAGLLLVVGTLAAPEVWLNSINAQVYLAMAALLLLFVRVDDLSRGRYIVGAVTLAVAGMSGLYTVALAPLFVVHALLDRTKRRWGLALVLVGVGLVQLGVHLTSKASGTFEGSKFTVPALRTLVNTIARLQFSGLVMPQRMLESLDGPTRLVAFAVAFGLVALIGALLWSAPSRRVGLFLVGAFLIVEALVQIGGLDGQVSGRYTVVPIGILTLLLVHSVAVSNNQLAVRVGLGVGAVVLVVGLADFWLVEPNVLRCRDCPEWGPEVSAHESGDDHQLEIWPYDRDDPWILRLPPPGRDG